MEDKAILDLYFARDEEAYTDATSGWMDCRFPKIMQDGRDGEEEVGYVGVE